MVAILEHRLPQPASERPDLRLVLGGRSVAGRAAMYRRRRLAALAVVVLVLIAAVGAIAIGRGALAGVVPHTTTTPAAATPGPGAHTIVVQPGDTLWAIARRIQPTGEVRPLVDRLAALHGPGVLQAGDRLVLPR
jgi:LysM repeat protein